MAEPGDNDRSRCTMTEPGVQIKVDNDRAGGRWQRVRQ